MARFEKGHRVRIGPKFTHGDVRGHEGVVDDVYHDGYAYNVILDGPYPTPAVMLPQGREKGWFVYDDDLEDVPHA